MDAAAGETLTTDEGAKRNKLIGAAVLLVLAAGCGYLATLYGFMAGMGAAIFGIAGLSVLASAFGFAGVGHCPTCGKEMRDLPRDTEAASCRCCGNFAIIRDAKLFPTPPDHVAKSSAYRIDIEPGVQPNFRGLCATCGKPATTSLPRELTKDVVGVPGVGRLAKTWTIDIAVCDEHSKPDSLGNPAGVTSFGGSLSISSHRTWRAITAKS